MSEAEIKKPASGLREASRGYSDLYNAAYNAAYEATLRRFETSRSFTISPELATKLEELALESGHSASEILQAGISLVELAVKAREKGKKFGVVEQDTPLVTEVVGL
jgi:predicted transcriptional regulator